MNIIRSAAIGDSVRDIAPKKIAVAYLGKGWEEYLTQPGDLEYIVVSTDIGTNPAAVAQLVHQIGWDKVFFLDELHAKIYVGDRSAMIGSANLANNGLSGAGLEEIAVVFNDTETLAKLASVADDILEKAQEQYPTVEKKKCKLEEMQRLWKQISWLPRHHDDPEPKAPDVMAYPFCDTPDFWVCWYHDGTLEFNPGPVLKETGLTPQELTQQDLYTNFSEDDVIQSGDWLLMWKARKDGPPCRYKEGAVFWRYVHCVVPHAVLNGGHYTKAVFELLDKKPLEPFEMTEEVQQAIIKILAQGSFEILRPNRRKKGYWRAGDTKNLLPRFCKAVKGAVANARQRDGKGPVKVSLDDR